MQPDRPSHRDRMREIEETHRLVEAIAQDLKRLYDGSAPLSRVVVERYLRRQVELACRGAQGCAGSPRLSGRNDAHPTRLVRRRSERKRSFC
jgi:hypothetical protein